LIFRDLLDLDFRNVAGVMAPQPQFRTFQGSAKDCLLMACQARISGNRRKEPIS